MAGMKLILAEGAVLERILRESHDIWSDSLSRPAYDRFNAAQMRTAWGSRRLRRVALVDDRGDLLSSAKRYDLDARLDRKSTRLNSSHGYISYAVFCLKKKKRPVQEAVAQIPIHAS